MKDKQIVFAVEQAVQQKRIDMLAFAEATGDKEVSEYYIKMRDGFHGTDSKTTYNQAVLSIDLENLKPDVARLICQFIYDELANREIMVHGFHVNRCIPANKIALEFPELQAMNVDALEEWLNNRSYYTESRLGAIDNFLSELKKYTYDIRGSEDIFSANIWNLKWFEISEERKNPAQIRNHIYFNGILNERNRHLIKKYAEYQIDHTSLSINGIAYNVSTLKVLLNLINKAYDEYTLDDGCALVEACRARYSNKKSLVDRFRILNLFTEYLLIHDLIEESPIKQFQSVMVSGAYEYKATAPSRYIITQIFNVLGKVKDLRLVIWFLVVYSVGSRGSEATRLEWDCLEKKDGGCFIRFYQTKMRKDVFNAIPLALYEMIDEYRHTLPVGTKYLFPSTRKGKILQRSTIVENLNNELAELGVKNPDGTAFHLCPHSLRHLIAVRMREEEIPYQFIQEQLHHESPEMTLAYIEYMDRQKASKIKKFYDANGSEAPVSSTIRIDDDEAYAEYMKKHMNAQMLPNGVCARPVKLGKCKHGNECLFCGDFRTSIEDLQTHIDHYERVCQYLEIAEKNGWLPQIETNRKLKERLGTIIGTLEKKVNEANE